MVPYLESWKSSLMETVASRSMIGMYERVAGTFKAVAAALRRLLQDSSQGEVPIVKFEESETRVWNVWRVGREISAD